MRGDLRRQKRISCLAVSSRGAFRPGHRQIGDRWGKPRLEAHSPPLAADPRNVSVDLATTVEFDRDLGPIQSPKYSAKPSTTWGKIEEKYVEPVHGTARGRVPATADDGISVDRPSRGNAASRPHRDTGCPVSDIAKERVQAVGRGIFGSATFCKSVLSCMERGKERLGSDLPCVADFCIVHSG